MAPTVSSKTYRRIAYGSGIVLFLLMLSLGSWYWYLGEQSNGIRTTGEGRAFDAGTPAVSARGSTFQNIISGLGFGSGRVGAQAPSDAGDKISSPLAEPSGFGGLFAINSENSVSVGDERAPVLGLTQIQETPVAGMGFVGTSSRLRFTDRATGYLFEADLETGEVHRLTSTLIPKVYRASFFTDGSFIGHALTENEDPYLFIGFLGTTTEGGLRALDTVSLDAAAIDALPIGRSRGYIALVEGGSGTALIRGSTEGRATRVATTTFKDWRLHAPSENQIIIAQSAATGMPGGAFQIDSGTMAPFARGIGLTILPEEGGAVLIGSDTGILRLMVRPERSASLADLPIRTVPEKCVWRPRVRSGEGKVAALTTYCAVPREVTSPTFLDEWYRGEIHTADTWWRVDVSTLDAARLPVPDQDLDKEFDVEYPVMDTNGRFVAFLNAHDKSLWVLRVE